VSPVCITEIRVFRVEIRLVNRWLDCSIPFCSVFMRPLMGSLNCVNFDAMAPRPVVEEPKNERPAANVESDIAFTAAGSKDIFPVVSKVTPRAARLMLHDPDRKSTRLYSSHEWLSYAVFWLQN